MTLPAGVDQASVTLFIGGLVGGILRAAMGKHQTWTRRTWLDIAIGGALSVVFPLFGVVPATGATLLQLGMLGLLLGLFGSYVLLFILFKVGVFREDIRAAKPDENGGTT